MESKSGVSTSCYLAETGGRPVHLPSPQNSSSTNSWSAPLQPHASVAYPFAPSHQNKRTTQEIVPMDPHHPILREFPEHREVIRRLKGSNDHFRSLFDEYHRLDDEIYRIEEEIDFATDQEIEELKMRRAKLKDYIYHVVRHAPPVPVCPTCE